MVVKFCSCLSEQIERTWREWEMKSSYSPFLYFDYMKSIYRQIRFFVWRYNAVIATVENENGEILMIAPLKRNVCTRAYKMLGDVRGCGEADFLFAPEASYEVRKKCVSLFMEKLGEKIMFRRIFANSCLTKILSELGYISSVRETPCVKICYGDDVEAHVKGLSSSVRQNIRTAYNRMKRDSMAYELKVYIGTNIMDNQVGRDIMNIYIRRQKLKYSKHKNLMHLPLDFVIRMKYRRILHDSVSLRNDGNSFHSVLYLNGKAVSFMSGFVDKQAHRVVVPRLAIDSDYGFYSPGYVMILETMKRLIEETNIRVIDLSRGDEKYKLDLGGTPYATHMYTCNA